MSFAHWRKLLYGIQKERCTRFLGPELTATSADGPGQVPARVLARRFLEGLGDAGAGGTEPPAGGLAGIAQRFVAREGEVGLEMELEQAPVLFHPVRPCGRVVFGGPDRDSAPGLPGQAHRRRPAAARLVQADVRRFVLSGERFDESFEAMSAISYRAVLSRPR